jgi:hypothetical protein
MNQAMEAFEKKERYLTEQFFKKIGITTYNLSECGSKSAFDGDYTTPKGVNVKIEIKVRSFPFGTYPDYILEKKTIEKWVLPFIQGNLISYINYFPAGVNKYTVIVFQITQRMRAWINGNWENCFEIRKMNDKTFISKYDKIDKAVHMLKFDPAIDGKFELNLN